MGMKIDFDTTPRQKFLPNCTRSASETNIIDAEIKKLSSKRGWYISLTPSPWTTQMDYPKNTISNEYCWSMCKQHLK